MSNRDTSLCRDYIENMVQRRARSEPGSPNWKDQPSCFKTYRQVERLALPTRLPTPLISMADLLERMRVPPLHEEGLTMEVLSTMLWFSQGVLSQRLGVGWSRETGGKTIYHQAATAYGRGTTTTAGTHPTEIYWAGGPGGSLLPGLYHYDGAHHALERLSIDGQVTRHIRAAVADHPYTLATDQFLLVTVNFWKSAFVHHARTYHTVIQDVGALLCSLRLLALSFGCELPLLLWYQDEALNRLLGLDTVTESVFAVVPIPSTVPHSAFSESTGFAAEKSWEHAPSRSEQEGLQANIANFQRSQTILRFPESERVHLASLIEHEPRPPLSVACQACLPEQESGGERRDLPLPTMAERLCTNVLQVFRQRTSSANRFSRQVPLSRAELASMLAFGAAACSYVTDLKQRDGIPHMTRLLAFVNAVEGLERGVYTYESNQHCLWSIQQGEVTDVLPRDYFLPKYDLTETSVVIAIQGRLDPLLDVYGNRGYRILQLEVGMVLQSIYLGATALGLGCGWKGGWDERMRNLIPGQEIMGEFPLLFLLLGHERAGKAGFDGQLI